ncbi:MAG: KpsF/GutQ family sugar-phosphate isomerase [Chitinophagaceae bacterium]|nr:KpsF/GutQ family sugar-phosphate isomerase [Chitinophagaceae bacterium]
MESGTLLNIKQVGLRTIQLEAEAISGLQKLVDDEFGKAVRTISDGTGRVVISGIGKSAIIAQKIVATLNSTGTPSIFLHAADAIHGDIGMIQQNDVVLVVSKSGESPEIKVLVPLVKNFGNALIAMVGNVSSYLARQSDIVLNTTVDQEACPNNLAPTSSTTAQLVMGDALAVALMELKGFGSDDFAKFHPGGTLGKKLYLRVADLYIQNDKPSVTPDESLKNVIVEISKNRLGATAVADSGKLLGVVTDGDLRRMLEKNEPLDKVTAKDIMSVKPKTILPEALAIDALDLMRKHDITQLVVASGGNYLGFIHLHDLVREGLI